MPDSKASIAFSFLLQIELVRVDSGPINPVRLEKAGLAESARLANQIWATEFHCRQHVSVKK